LTKIPSAVLLVLAFGAPASAQHIQVRVHTLAAARQDAPVRVIRLVLWPDRAQPFNPNIVSVVLQNDSTKRVASIDLASETAAPEGCVPHPHRQSFSTGSGPYPVDVAPGEEVQVLTGVAAPTHAVSTSLWVKSRYVQVQVGVARVDFVDGSSWKRWEQQKEKHEGPIFDLSQLQFDSYNCTTWRWSERLDPLILEWNDPRSLRLRTISWAAQTPPGSPALPEAGAWQNRSGQTEAGMPSYYYDCDLDLSADAARCGSPRTSEETRQLQQSPK
jgi:hypothetical protein